MSSCRSYLFVPSLQQSMMEKAILSRSDSVIFDLEDAVAVSEKKAARENVAEALSALNGRKPVYVRINDVTTSYWEEDLKTALNFGADGVIIPKAESVKGILLVSECIHDTVGDRSFNIIPLVETAKGIEFAYEIAKSCQLISHLAFGSIDFSLDIGCELTNEGNELLFARSRLVVASRAAGIGKPIDSVYPDLSDEEGLKQEALAAKKLGFGAKLIIHPKQIEPINTIYSPSADRILEARRIVAEFEKAEEQGVASIRVNNQFVDYPIYKKAKELLNLINNLN